jgi:hypothetical protein
MFGPLLSVTQYSDRVWPVSGSNAFVLQPPQP